MRRISRRDFIKGLGGLGICALGVGAFLSCSRKQSPSSVTDRVVEGIELTKGEDYLKLEDGGIRCLGCLNRCVIAEEGRGDVPLHFTRFFPQYKLTHLSPTPINNLEKAREIALEVGLKYVYIGNVPGHEANSTYCPKCGQKVIHRFHYAVLKSDAEGGRCKFCGEEIPGI
jgi:predicted RNA-binding Zn-ribbon protein involved in translation (DUF1610 family)